MNKISKLKTKLRKKNRRLKISAAAYKRQSRKLALKIQKAHFFKHAESIGFYAALPDEAEISSAAQKALKLGKKVFFPRIHGKKIIFYQVTNLKEHLKYGRFGILEPVLKKFQRRRALDLILIPGRAFDKKGGRLGRGGGHYDRLLEKWPGSVRVGIAFKEQIVARVPREAHDIGMDIVLTA